MNINYNNTSILGLNMENRFGFKHCTVTQLLPISISGLFFSNVLKVKLVIDMALCQETSKWMIIGFSYITPVIH